MHRWKEYYGNVYFKNGVKFAGTSTKSGTNIRVLTREASISGVNVPVQELWKDQTIRTTTPAPETQQLLLNPNTQPQHIPSPSPSPAPFLLQHQVPARPTILVQLTTSPPPSGGGGYGVTKY